MHADEPRLGPDDESRRLASVTALVNGVVFALMPLIAMLVAGELAPSNIVRPQDAAPVWLVTVWTWLQMWTAILPLSLEGAMILLPIVGIALNGTSSVLYGSVPDLVDPSKRQRAFGIFYTGTIGAGAVSPAIYGLLGDAIGVTSTLLVIAAFVLVTLPITLVLRPALPAMVN